MTDHKPLTAAELAAIRERVEKATPVLGTSYHRYDHGGGRACVDNPGHERVLVLDTFNEADREFYFSARTDIPALLRDVGRMREALLELSGDGNDINPACAMSAHGGVYWWRSDIQAIAKAALSGEEG